VVYSAARVETQYRGRYGGEEEEYIEGILSRHRAANARVERHRRVGEMRHVALRAARQRRAVAFARVAPSRRVRPY